MYLLFLLLFLLVAIVVVSIYYYKEKSTAYDTISRGFCPKCRQKSIVLTDKRGGGCSGTLLLSYECDFCGYRNTFSVSDSGCSGGSCGCP